LLIYNRGGDRVKDQSMLSALLRFLAGFTPADVTLARRMKMCGALGKDGILEEHLPKSLKPSKSVRVRRRFHNLYAKLPHLFKEHIGEAPKPRVYPTDPSRIDTLDWRT